jgi:O-antigen ligase
MSSWAERSKNLGGRDGVTLIVGLGLAFFFLTRISLGVSVFALALLGVFHAVKNRKVHSQFSWRDGQWFIIAAILPLAYFFRMLVSDFDHRLLDKVVRFILIIPIYWIVRSYGISASKVLVCISASVLVAGFDSFSQVSKGIERVSGASIPSPIPFGNFALLFGVLSILLTFPEKEGGYSGWPKWVGVGGFSAGIFTSVASGTRGGWVAIPFFMLIIWAFWGPKRKSTSYAVLMAILVAIPLVAYLTPAISDRLAVGIAEAHSYLSRTSRWAAGEATSSIGIRLDMWTAGLEAFLSAPAFGLGFAGFNDFLHHRIEMGLSHSDLETTEFKHLHCEIVTTAAKIGLMGLFALAILWVGGIRWFLRDVTKNTSDGKMFRVMGLITFTAMIAYSMTDSMFGMTLHSMVYTMLLGISAGGLRHAELNPVSSIAGR